MTMLFHGSNMEIQHPIVQRNAIASDFGVGFYLTSNEVQAGIWAKEVTEKKGWGIPTVNVFSFDDEKISTLNCRFFQHADEEWLNFIELNRKRMADTVEHDLVIGPCAKVHKVKLIDEYIQGDYGEEVVLAELGQDALTDQFAFLNQTALQFLIFVESKKVSLQQVSER
ncbi:MAG: DUF3990 domain-containing protein [Streptococcaceae bacterium]|jgi:hypothetical protein|nr:DUF3990 domain-containing protein [Streptococcaceae bacterium]